MRIVKGILIVLGLGIVFCLGSLTEAKFPYFDSMWDKVTGIFGDKYTLEEAVELLNDEDFDNFSIDINVEYLLEYETGVVEKIYADASIDVLFDAEKFTLKTMIDVKTSSKGDNAKKVLTDALAAQGLSSSFKFYIDVNLFDIWDAFLIEDVVQPDSFIVYRNVDSKWADYSTEGFAVVSMLFDLFSNYNPEDGGDLEEVVAIEADTESEGNTDGDTEAEDTVTGFFSVDLFEANDKGTYDIVGFENVYLNLKKGIGFDASTIDEDGDTINVSILLDSFDKVKITTPKLS